MVKKALKEVTEEVFDFYLNHDKRGSNQYAKDEDVIEEDVSEAERELIKMIENK